MRALVVRSGRITLDRAHPEPRAAPGEARVDVLLAGICATDLEIVGGYMGFAGVPGHEFVGIAREGRFAGARVVGEINAACGECERCARGLDRHCARRTVLGILGRDGAFAESLVLPERNLRRVPDSIPNEAAVFAEPLAAALEIVERIPAAARGRVAVLGDGRLGILCGLVLKGAGAEVTQLGRHQEKLAIVEAAGIAARRVGAAAPAELRAAFPVVVEASGSAEGLAMALELVEPRGTVVLKTTTHEIPKQSLAPVVIDEVAVVGSRCGRIEPALRALESGRIDPRVLIADRMALDDGPRAFERARGALKILLQIGSQR